MPSYFVTLHVAEIVAYEVSAQNPSDAIKAAHHLRETRSEPNDRDYRIEQIGIVELDVLIPMTKS